ncbi:hypothetical protein PENTCL1PPCAC_27791, partial [Pristionchus entomophagus]
VDNPWRGEVRGEVRGIPLLLRSDQVLQEIGRSLSDLIDEDGYCGPRNSKDSEKQPVEDHMFRICEFCG